MRNAVYWLFGAPNTKSRRFSLIAASLGLMLFVGVGLGRMNEAGAADSSVYYGGATALAAVTFLSAELARRATEHHRQLYDVREHVVISSDDAYDYADKLEGDETVLEDKGNGECYLAERRGDSDA